MIDQCGLDFRFDWALLAWIFAVTVSRIIGFLPELQRDFKQFFCDIDDTIGPFSFLAKGSIVTGNLPL
jgi:hypothetical protein